MSSLILAAIFALAHPLPAVAQEIHSFSVGATDPSSAIRTLGHQAGIQILASASDLKGKQFHPVSGEISTEEALSDMLEGSGLDHRYVATRAVALVSNGPGGGARGGAALESNANASSASGSLGEGSQATQIEGAPGAIQRSGDLDEIIVTANRTAEPLSKVPVSIAAYNQATLDRIGVRSVDDLTRLTPGVNFDRNGFGLQSSISIRGVASNVGSATTGIYIDETPIQARNLGNSSGNTYPVVFDLDRVEVLRGPQGTLFGAASEGGTVRFITPPPNLATHDGYTRVEVATTKSGDPSYEFGGAFGGPIIQDLLAFRVSAYHRRDGGYVDRERFLDPSSGEKNTNYLDSNSLRAAVTWIPTSGLSVSPSILFQQLYQNDAPTVWSTLSDPASLRYVTGAGSATTSHDRFALPALAVKADFASMTLYSNTSYFDRRERTDYDYTLFDISYFALGGDPTPFYSIPGYYSRSPQSNSQKNFTQEIRLQSAEPAGRVSWVVGTFYSHALQTARESVNSPFLGDYFGAPPEVIFGAPLINGITAYIDNFDDKDTELAGFANTTVAITERLKATAGVRVSRTKFEFVEAKDGPAAGGPSTSSGSQSETPVTPKFGISYQQDDDNLYYVSAARGYRVGGANPAIPSYPGCDAALASLGLRAAPTTYRSDSTWSYEIGSKNRLAGGAVTLAGSLYYIDWSNIIQAIPNLANCPFSFTTNLGSAISKGFDFQTEFQLSEALVVGMSVGYNNAKYTKTVRAAGATQDLVTDGHTLGGSPWTLVGTGEYRFEGLIGKEAYFRAVIDYRSVNNGLTSTNDPTYSTYDPLVPNPPSMTNLDLRAGTRLASGWDISAFGKNVLNRKTPIDFTRDAVGAEVFHYTPTRPLTVGVTISRQF